VPNTDILLYNMSVGAGNVKSPRWSTQRGRHRQMRTQCNRHSSWNVATLCFSLFIL